MADLDCERQSLLVRHLSLAGYDSVQIFVRRKDSYCLACRLRVERALGAVGNSSTFSFIAQAPRSSHNGSWLRSISTGQSLF